MFMLGSQHICWNVSVYQCVRSPSFLELASDFQLSGAAAQVPGELGHGLIVHFP